MCINANDTRNELQFFTNVKRNPTGLYDRTLSFPFTKRLQYKTRQSLGRMQKAWGKCNYILLAEGINMAVLLKFNSITNVKNGFVKNCFTSKRECGGLKGFLYSNPFVKIGHSLKVMTLKTILPINYLIKVP